MKRRIRKIRLRRMRKQPFPTPEQIKAAEKLAKRAGLLELMRAESK